MKVNSLIPVFQEKYGDKNVLFFRESREDVVAKKNNNAF